MDTRVLEMRNYFNSGITKSYSFRIEQLKKLKDSIKFYEKNIIIALNVDMKKPEYEAYASEIAIIYQEINEAINNLEKWMSNEKVPTPLYLKPATSYIEKVPKGIVLIISPWNYPFLLTFSPLVSAIAAGNCVFIKSSTKSYYSHRLINRIINQTFEENYISRLAIDGKDMNQIVKDFDFDHIFFTGGTATGRLIAEAAGKNLIPVTLELGGKSPTIVDDTINLDLAAKKITWAKFLNLGQTCIAPDYIIVKENIKEDFIQLCKSYIKKFYGDSLIENQNYGKIINLENFNRLNQLLKDKEILYGGTINKESLYISPTIINSSPDDSIMEEEIFGPIMPILTFENFDDILSIINKNPNPLALYIFSENEEFISKITNRIQFGGGCINDTISHMVNTNLPFGGVKQSGVGRYHSYYGFCEFSHFRSILTTNTNIDIAIKYPPYTKTKNSITKLLLK